jgi:hypothetical protein
VNPQKLYKKQKKEIEKSQKTVQKPIEWHVLLQPKAVMLIQIRKVLGPQDLDPSFFVQIRIRIRILPSSSK